MDMNRRMLVQVSKMYYEDDMTQQQIAERVNVSRMKVSRLLQKAKDEGIVHIAINYAGIYLELEKRICQKYQLKDVVIVDTSLGAAAKEQVAAAAAYYLELCLKKDATIAVGWGTTIRQIPQYIHSINSRNLVFSPIIGGHGQSELDMHATMIAANFAKKTGGKSLSLNAPALVADKGEKNILIRDGQIKDVLDCSANADYAVFSLGNPVVQDSSISKSGYISEDDLEDLKKAGAICDVVSLTFLNEAAEVCCKNITDRCISINPSQLKAIPRKICVVESEEKKKTTKAALKGGFIDVLITDLVIAEYLDTEIV